MYLAAQASIPMYRDCGFDSNLWPSAACHPPLSHLVSPVSLQLCYQIKPHSDTIDTCGKCSDISLKTTSGIMLTKKHHLKQWSLARQPSCWAATSPPSTSRHVKHIIWGWYDTYGRNLNIYLVCRNVNNHEWIIINHPPFHITNGYRKTFECFSVYYTNAH